MMVYIHHLLDRGFIQNGIFLPAKRTVDEVTDFERLSSFNDLTDCPRSLLFLFFEERSGLPG